jgi:AraC-like DNA-binding protein
MSYFGEFELAKSSSVGEIVLAHHRSRSCLGSHHHAEPYLSLCLDGGYLEDYDGGVDEVQRGDLFLHPACETHANDMDGRGATILNLQVSLSIQRLYDVSELYSTRLRTRCSEASLGLLEKVLLDRTERSTIFDLISAAEILLPSLKERPRRDWKLARVTARIEADPDYPWTLDELSIIAGYHRVYFAQKFKLEFGCPPGEYIRKSRMRAAARFICIEGASITEAAHASGFFDSAHMANSFRRLLGITPSALRGRQHILS